MKKITDPVEFAEKVLGVKLYPFQKKILREMDSKKREDAERNSSSDKEEGADDA